MEEFLIVLAIAIVIIVVLVVFSFGPAVQPPPQPANTSVESFSLGTVGFTKSSPMESISLGSFTAGTTQDEKLKSVSTEEISAGWLGGHGADYIISIDQDPLTSLEKVIMEFDVSDTNQYGNLVVSWNDEIIFNELAKKEHYKIEVPKEKASEKNNLKIYTSASLRFWASTTYILNNLEVKGEFGKAKVSIFSLEQDDFDKFDRGVISFSADSTNSGKLVIKVNGHEIYNKKPGRMEQVNFTHQDVGLAVGNNIISFRADGGFFELDNVKIELYTLSSSLVKKRSFKITDSQFASLDNGPGTISLTVDSVLRPGTLLIKLNNKEALELIPSPGLNNITFEKSKVMIGMNEVEFSSPTGTFEISKVEIRP